MKLFCYVCAAHLYQHLNTRGQMIWGSVLCSALLYVKGRSIPTLVGALAAQLRLPEGIRHVWIVDRGIISRSLLRALEAISQYALGRVKANQVVYFAPRRQPKKGRKKSMGRNAESTSYSGDSPIGCANSAAICTFKAESERSKSTTPKFFCVVCTKGALAGSA